jgi:hypothetical protein
MLEYTLFHTTTYGPKRILSSDWNKKTMYQSRQCEGMDIGLYETRSNY